MILKLILCILDQLLRVSNDFIQFLHPLGDNSQDRGRFHEEYSVFDLFVSVFGCVLVDLLADGVFRVITHLLCVHLVLMGLFGCHGRASLMQRTEDFLKNLTEKVFEIWVLLIAALDHIIDSLHDFLRIVGTLFPPKNDLLGLAHLTD